MRTQKGGTRNLRLANGVAVGAHNQGMLAGRGLPGAPGPRACDIVTQIMAAPALEVAVTNLFRRLPKVTGGMAERQASEPGSPSTMRRQSGRDPRSTVPC